MWTEPKTDWKITDKINKDDFNRVRGNLMALQELAAEVYPEFLLRLPDEKGYSDWPYADEYNLIEQALETVNVQTYQFDIGSTKTFYDNQPYIKWDEFQRIEEAMLRLYNHLQNQAAGRPRLAFVLGRGGRF